MNTAVAQSPTPTPVFAAPKHTTEPDRAARQREVVAALASVLPAHSLLWNQEDTTPYE